jgi:hypothetical protein
MKSMGELSVPSMYSGTGTALTVPSAPLASGSLLGSESACRSATDIDPTPSRSSALKTSRSNAVNVSMAVAGSDTYR